MDYLRGARLTIQFGKPDPAVVEALRSIQAGLTGLRSDLAGQALRLARIEQKLDAVTSLENTEMLNVTALTEAVTRETAVDDSILELVKRIAANEAALAQQLKDALASGDLAALAAVQEAIDASAVTMKANADRIAAAVIANTPAAVTPA